jgi:hypothetical protein
VRSGEQIRPNNSFVTVEVSDFNAPGLVAGATYALTGSSYNSSGGVTGPIAVIQITAPNGVLCAVSHGSVTVNKLVTAALGRLAEAQASWTGMACTTTGNSAGGATTTAMGTGCFHVF